ncbi:ATP-binding protein [Haloglycomyces albus]|uniref:ATP-binding protein n=1 Tax=Haloglycomyces albus TaxID=526067 RepID=UPI00046D50F7|nr:ATP-binding protein [Haloglycomyces albus]
MKIAFVGKGGSGKTTLASLFARHAADAGSRVMALDADINQHFATALGMDPETAERHPRLAEYMSDLKTLLRGSNPRIPNNDLMLKTTPPGPGSTLLTLEDDNPVFEAAFSRIGDIRFAATGGFDTEDLGIACYHSKVGAVEMILNHLIDRTDEFVVVDMVAGAEAFASGMFTRFDHTFLVCEPTLRSVGVYEQYAAYAADYDVNIAVIGNKIDEDDDIEFLKRHVGDDLAAVVGRSRYVKAAERGVVGPISELEPDNRQAIDRLHRCATTATKNWTKFSRQAHEFHARAAKSWGNDRTGSDLTQQIVSDYILGPHLLPEV